MYIARRLFYVCIFLLITGSLAGCGNATPSSSSGSASSSPGPTGTTGSASASPSKTASKATPSTVPADTSGGSQGQVRLELSKNTYATGDSITVLIINNSGQSIFVSPYQTQCTKVTLEGFANNAWGSRKDCFVAPASGFALTEIKTGQDEKQTLRPLSGSVMRPASSSGVWLAGIYRITLAYSLTPDSENATYTWVHSSTFEIK